MLLFSPDLQEGESQDLGRLTSVGPMPPCRSELRWQHQSSHPGKHNETADRGPAHDTQECIHTPRSQGARAMRSETTPPSEPGQQSVALCGTAPRHRPWGPCPCQHQGPRAWSATRAREELFCLCKGRGQLEPVRRGSRPERGAQMTPHIWLSFSLSIKDILGQKKGDVLL